MYTLLVSHNPGDVLRREALPFGVAWLLAEMFYKFHSFTLEAAAFLVTWFVLGAATGLVRKIT